MDSQVDSETLNNLLENDIISLSGGESDKDLLGSDPDTNSREDMRIKKHFSILDELMASPPIHNSTNTNMSTTSFTTNTTISTHTLRHHPTAATLPISTTPLSPNTSCNASPSLLHTNPSSTSTSTPKSTPSDIQSEHLPFTFHFIPSHPNYISKLKLPMHIAKLCSEIQHNAESSIIQIIEKHLSKQKHKKLKKNKNNIKKTHNLKLRFQPIEHPPTSPPYTATKTHTITTTKPNTPILKTTATQCTHPTLKTTGTQYIQPTSQNHTSTHTKFQHPPPYQPNTHHTSQYTHRSTPSDNHNPFKHSSTSSLPSPLLTLQTTTHLPYHIQSQPIHKTLTNTIHQPSSTSAPQASHTHQHCKPTLINTTQLPQHPSHNTRHKHNKNFNTLQRRPNQTNTINHQHITTSTNNIATASPPMPLLFHRDINPAMMELLLQRGKQPRHR